MTYEAWRITYQSSEQAARAAYAQIIQLSNAANELALALEALVDKDLTSVDREIVAGIEAEDVLKARSVLADYRAGRK
jgi:hypothetical protein